MTAPARLDHLVVLAATLAEGVAWCEATLGLTPGPGGPHPLMGTHNRLLRLAGADWPLAYLEIIAIDPAAAAPAHPRWFDMDDAALQARVRRAGPQLVHWVARVDDAPAAVAALQALGLERGAVRAASRPTPQGVLQWRITLRPDGQRLLDGLLPTLIEWGPVHPAAAMPANGLALRALTLRHPQAELLRRACAALGLEDIDVQAGPARLRAVLQTPRGAVELVS